MFRKSLCVILAILVLPVICLPASANTNLPLTIGQNPMEDGGSYAFTADQAGFYSLSITAPGEEWADYSIMFSTDECDEAYATDEYTLYYLAAGATLAFDLETSSQALSAEIAYYGVPTAVALPEDAPLQIGIDVFAEPNEPDEQAYLYFQNGLALTTGTGDTLFIPTMDVAVNNAALTSGSATITVTVGKTDLPLAVDLFTAGDYITEILLPDGFEPKVTLDEEGWRTGEAYPDSLTAVTENGNVESNEESGYGFYRFEMDDGIVVTLYAEYADDDSGKTVFTVYGNVVDRTADVYCTMECPVEQEHPEQEKPQIVSIFSTIISMLQQVISIIKFILSLLF